MMRKYACVWPLMLFGAQMGLGGILFDTARNVILITDYPAAYPCALAQVARCDRAFGWDKVRYDKTSDTYTIDCHLAIGANDGSETYFQVGSAECPRATLVMNGNIYVQPYAGEVQWWQTPAKVNRLTLGCLGNKDVCAVLKFAPSNSLVAGSMADGKGGRGGQLFVYNSQITALDPDKGFGINDGGRDNSLRQVGGDGLVLMNARIAHARGHLCYGAGSGLQKIFSVSNTTFSDYGALLPQSGKYVNCVFEGAKAAAIRDWGGLNIELTDCVFKNNVCNWELTYSDDGLTLIDCEWHPPRKRDSYRISTDKTGKKQYPKLSVRRHIVAEVLDGSGKPVQDAVVSFRAEQDGCDLIQSRTFKTDASGKTPGQGQANALLLTESITTATATPDQPGVKRFTYSLAAEKAGKRAMLTNVNVDCSWKTITIKLAD